MKRICAALLLLTLLFSCASAEIDYFGDYQELLIYEQLLDYFMSKDKEYEYTQEIIREEFHVFIPSVFKQEYDSIFYSLDNSKSEYPYISVYYCTENSDSFPISYTNTDECMEVLKFLSFGKNYTVVRVDECAGILTVEESDDSYYMMIGTTNRKHSLGIGIRTETQEEGLSLVNGILEHIVAPEMPLE